MKRIKAVACVVSVAMLAGLFAGCSKTTKMTAERFASVCEKLDFEEFDIDDDDAPDTDDLEDGIYFVIDDDYIEDTEDEMDDAFESMGLDDVFEAGDIKSVSVAAKFEGLDGFKDIEEIDDLEDLEVDGAFAVQISLEDGKYAEDFMDYLSDKLDDMEINTKDLTSKEYYSGKNDGYFRFHIDIAEFCAIALENDDLLDFADEYGVEDEFEDALNALTGDIAISVEINGSNIFIIGGVAINHDTTTLNSFVKSFGAAANPAAIPMNKEVCEEMVDELSENASSIAYYIYFALM